MEAWVVTAPDGAVVRVETTGIRVQDGALIFTKGGYPFRVIAAGAWTKAEKEFVDQGDRT